MNGNIESCNGLDNNNSVNGKSMNSITLIDNGVNCNIVVNNSVNGKSVNNMANNVTLPNNIGNYDNMFNNSVQDNGVNDDNMFNNNVLYIDVVNRVSRRFQLVASVE